MLVVKKSRIKNAGNGLFTTSYIRKGDLIVQYKGENLTWKACVKRYGKDVNLAKYLYFVSDKNCIDAQNTPHELARYANDANGFRKHPKYSNNADYTNVRGVPYIIANRNINPGEEIFVDYQREYWEAIEEELIERGINIHDN